MLIDISKITYKEFTELKKKYSVIGRPRKYYTEEERREANRKREKEWREAKKKGK